jgi:hypothetical protein
VMVGVPMTVGVPVMIGVLVMMMVAVTVGVRCGLRTARVFCRRW